MHFTVVFGSREAYDLSYSLLFIPCPVWQQGDRKVVNLHPKDPHYRRGDLKKLLELEEIESRLEPGTRKAAVIVHPDGIAGQADLDGLLEELMGEGFVVGMLTL